jgi:hypothetical protein
LRQHHTCPGYGVIGHNHFAHGDPDPDIGPYFIVETRQVIGLCRLKGESGGHCFGGAIELGEQGIAAKFVHSAGVLRDYIAKAAKGVLDAIVGQVLILLNQLGRGSDVRVQDYGKYVRLTTLSHL